MRVGSSKVVGCPLSASVGYIAARPIEKQLTIEEAKAIMPAGLGDYDGGEERTAAGRGSRHRSRRSFTALHNVREGAIRRHQLTYSITSSAVASSDEGTVRPSALAALRLITSSNLVGCWIGRLAGFSPLRMRSTYPAAWRNCSVKSVP